MDADTKTKLKPILLSVKLGEFVSEDESAFARRCWRAWPKEYSALQTEEVNPEAAQQIANAQPPAPRPAPTPRKPTRRGRGA